MPEFEENSPQSNPAHNYSPSTDAKPRTRRRSGGFKKEYDNTPKGNMGEVDPTEALKSEKLSGAPSATQEDAPSQKKRERSSERPSRPERKSEPERVATPQPSPETLAAIQRVEERIATRKADRDAKYEARKKSRAAEKAAKPAASNKAKPAGKKPAKKSGLIASILSIFGLGPKQPAKKQSSNRKGGRPQGKGHQRGGQNRRRGGQNRRRGGQNRRRQSTRSE